MLKAKFHDAIQRIFPNGIPRRVGVALSGGIDSMCLTSLLHDYIKSNSLETQIYPITINHNLRHSSTMEIPIIRKYLKEMGVCTSSYLSKSIDIQFKNDSSFEEVARIERYKALKSLCNDAKIQHIFLAHHLDDQLETFIMRLLRNSGIFGLNGMDWRSKSSADISPQRLDLVRPMLEINKNEIYEYCLSNNIHWVQDFTNFEEINQRNTIRKYLNDNEDIKKEVLSEFYKVRKLNSYIENQVNVLHNELTDQSKISSKPLNIIITLSNDQIHYNSDLVIARLLFKELYPLSPSRNYHYSFHKVLESISKIFSDNTFSLLQLQWNVKVLPEGICISIKRQNLKDSITQTISINPNSETDWILFDNRFWIKLKNPSNEITHYTIKTLMKNDKMKFEQVPKDFKYSKFTNLPVLIDTNSNKIISNITEDNNDNIKWQLKENIYTFR